jgi:hypothetical protein
MSIVVTDKTAPATGPSADFRHVPQRFGSYDNQDAGKQLFLTSAFAALMAPDGTITNPAAIGGSANFDWWTSGACPIDDTRAFIVGRTGVDFLDGGLNYYNTAAWFFDWSSGAFTPATAPPTATKDNFGQPICTRLADGRVFVYLGIGIDGLEHCYIFDPAGAAGAGTWTATGAWPGPNEPFTEMCLLPSGRVLAVGDSSSATPSKEFDPTSGTWSDSTNGPDRSNTSDLRIPLKLLHSGKVALVMSSGFVSIYDPATTTWTDQPLYSGGLTYNGNWCVEYAPDLLMIGDMNLAGAPRLLYNVATQAWDTLAQTAGLLEAGGWLTLGVWFGIALWRNKALQFFTLAAPPPGPVTPTTPTQKTSSVNVFRDFKVDPITGEIALSGGDFQFTSGIEAIAQACRFALGLILGEWFADTTKGTDVFGRVLVKTPDFDQIRGLYRERLRKVPGVVSVITVDVVFDGATRTATISWSVRANLGVINDSIQVAPTNSGR